MTAERSINHHFTYHIARTSQGKHGSLVDRGANGGNRKISMIIPLVSCCSCVKNPSSS